MANLSDGTDSGTSQPASRTSGYLKALKVPVVLTMIGVGLLAAYYSLYVRNTVDYLRGRDLRLLSTLGGQIELSLVDHETVLSSFSTYYGGRQFAEQFRCIVQEAQSIPMFAYIAPEQPPAAQQPDPPECVKPVQPKNEHGLRNRISVRFFEKDSGAAWTRRGEASGTSPEAAAPFRVDLTRVLAPLFSHHVSEDTFDALVLLTPSGRVIHAEGAFDLRLTSLDNILRRQPDDTWKTLPFAGLGHTSQVFDVEISGERYALYLQPCCTSLTDTGHAEKEPGWVVGGLTASSKLRNAGFAVSFSVIAFTGGVILLAIFSWPFLKLALIGPEQRLRLIDVFLVGICTLLGIALVTLFVVDWYSYKRLNESVDEQLKGLSEQIQQNVRYEVLSAYGQLTSLDAWATDKIEQANPTKPNDSGSNPFTTDEDWLGSQQDAQYPFFESFALIDAEGMQRRKWAVAPFRTPLVSTKSREYFQHWRPPNQTRGQGYFLESIRSRTTGGVEAVLSKPAYYDKDMAVAALTIPMVSLNEAALPPGFEFVVIDQRGRVMFHSDPRHNLDEQFFLETDSHRRLRSAVAARRGEELNLRYFGQDHRAYVAPVEDLNGSTWSLVTLFDKQLVRTVNIEWLITTMLFTIIYAAIYLVLCLIVLLSRPGYRAPWLWPDARKHEKYQHLLIVYSVFALAFVVALYGLGGGHLLAMAWVLPFIVWMATYLTLATPRAGSPRRRWLLLACRLGLSLLLVSSISGAGTPGIAVAGIVVAGMLLSLTHFAPAVQRPYSTAAVLLLLLTVVMPTLAFFKVALVIQVESYIKYGQLTLAQEIQRRGARTTSVVEQAHKNLRTQRRAFNTYGKPFFGSTIADTGTDTPDAVKKCEQGTAVSDTHDDLPAFLEDMLPYYSESSVGMRELLHNKSSDKAWSWPPHDGELVLRAPAEGSDFVCVRSTLPPLAGVGLAAFATPQRAAEFSVLSGLVLFAVFWVVQFVTRRVFLIDVIEPLWARKAASIPMHPGEHLYLVWRPADRNGRALIEDGMCVVDLATATLPVEEWFAAQRDRLEQLATGETVVIDHLETRTVDAAFGVSKLALVRDALDVQHRTVVLVSALGPTSLVNRIANASSADTAPLERRWRSLLGRFTVLDGVRFYGPSIEPATVAAVAGLAAPGLGAAPAGIAALAPTATAAPAPSERSALMPSTPDWAGDEQDTDPMIRSVWEEVRALAKEQMAQTPLDREQLFEEVSDRLDNYHRGIWSSCSDAQKIVLQQLANEGLINEKNRRTVRLLLARGLIRKDPDFRFVNETFRRFVLSRVPAEEVAIIEQRSTSPWNAVRMPFLVTLLAISAFFFLTQRELFTTTIAVITALAGGIPALVRVVGLFERRPDRAPAE